MVFVEVVRGCGVGFVERVEEGGVEGSEGEFVDDVGEVEGCGVESVFLEGFCMGLREWELRRTGRKGGREGGNILS